jgi:hypothetical protein
MARALRPSRLVWLAAAVAACNGIVGIEDLHEGPRSGNDTGAEGGDGGTTSAGKAGSGGTKPEGGTDAKPEGGTGAIGPGGAANAGEGPEPLGGDSAGGSANPPTSTVTGHVIDMWGHKLPNIPVRIGDAVTSTDEDGAFTLDDIPATYDASVLTTYSINAFDRTFAFVYQGLSRRDPTLQVVRSYSPTFGKVLITPKNAVVAADQTISVTIAGKDCNNDLTGLGSDEKSATVAWENGERSTQTTAHGLFWQKDDTSGLPTSYLAHASTPVLLTENATASFSLDLKNGSLDAGQLQGTVTPNEDTDRINSVYLHFTGGATMELVYDYTGPNTFSYLVPSIPGSTITVTATEGDNSGNEDSGFFALARVTGLSPTSKPTLKIPVAATPTSPGRGAMGVTNQTKFVFQAPASNPGPFVVHIDSGLYRGGVFIITAQKQVSVPSNLAGDFTLEKNTEHIWNVSTHGKFGSVDAMASPTGFIQPFEMYSNYPEGPLQEDGEFTRSATFSFTTAP